MVDELRKNNIYMKSQTTFPVPPHTQAQKYRRIYTVHCAQGRWKAASKTSTEREFLRTLERRPRRRGGPRGNPPHCPAEKWQERNKNRCTKLCSHINNKAEMHLCMYVCMKNRCTIISRNFRNSFIFQKKGRHVPKT